MATELTTSPQADSAEEEIPARFQAMARRYPITIRPGGEYEYPYTVEFGDWPNERFVISTGGETPEEALAMAYEALALTLWGISDSDPGDIPVPSAGFGDLPE